MAVRIDGPILEYASRCRRHIVANPIYKLFLGTPKPNWFQLSKDEQDKMLAKLRTLLEKAGGKSVVLCNSAWSSEKWAYFGLEEFPNIEAVQKHSELMAETNWPFEFVKSFSILGTKMP
jgi:hypothetical protein